MERKNHLLDMHPMGNDTLPLLELQTLYINLLNYLKGNDFEAFKTLFDNFKGKYGGIIDINHVENHSTDMTYLDVACENGKANFVTYLLAQGADPNRMNKIQEYGPIHFAIRGGYTDVLKILLNEPTIDPNLIGDQQTALHLAVHMNNLECIELLLDRGADPNIPNQRMMTPIHLAAMKARENIVKSFFEKSKLRIDLDSYKGQDGQTARQVLQKKLPNIPLLLPIQEKTQVDFHDLRYYLNTHDQEKFSTTLPKVNVDKGMVIELLKITVEANLRESVPVLLDKITKENLDGLLEIARIAVHKGHHEILEKLIQLDSSLANGLIIYAGKKLRQSNTITNRTHKELLQNRLQCLKVILMQPNVNLECEDELGNTPLHYVTKSGSIEAMELLLERGCYIGHLNKDNEIPIADIPPEILSKCFDNCLNIARKDKREEDLIEFNYRCLMPHNTDNNSWSSETEILRYIADRNDLKHLLTHPFLSSFLYLKWHGIRHVIYMNLIFYVIFYLFINACIFVKSIPADNTVLNIATMIALMCLTTREILKFLSSPFYFICSFSNWLDIVLISLSTLFLLGIVPQIRAVIILLSTWQLILSIGDHPKMSTGIEMFKRVSWTFIKFLFPYVICIVAFAFAFSTLFKSDDNFKDFGSSLFKTIIMLTGEFDAGDLPFTILGRCIFIIFVFSMAIILLNLLNGLAVSDTAEVLKKAELVGLISRTKSIAYFENIAIGAPLVRASPRWCCINFSILNLGFNPFHSLAKRILLFPSYLQDGKLSVPLYNNSQILVRNKLNMDEQICKQVRDLLFRKDQENNSNQFSLELERLVKRLTSIESSIDTIEHVIKNKH